MPVSVWSGVIFLVFVWKVGEASDMSGPRTGPHVGPVWTQTSEFYFSLTFRNECPLAGVLINGSF